jgi:hypothetical protein
VSLQSKVLEPKQAVLEGKINYVKIWIKGKLELVCCQWNTYRTPEKKHLDSNISENVDTVTNFDETTEEKKEDLDDSLSNSSFGK